MILGVFTELLGPGGIQIISRHTAAVLAAFSEARGHPVRLLSLNDPPGTHEIAVDGYPFQFEGFGRHKRRFALAVAAAARRTSLAYVGHPNLAPLGLLLRLVRPAARYAVATYGIDVWQPLPFPNRLGLRGASVVTALSAFTGERMVAAQRLDRNRVRLLPPALDPIFLRVAVAGDGARAELPAGRVLLTVARLAASERYKGVDTVIRALPRVLEALPDALYVVVGDGDDRPELERLAEESGMAQRVVFAGAKVGEELAAYYRACDVFVMPSKKEGFGVVFLEAMAFGKPVVGGNHGGTPEVVQDGVTGFLVEYGDEAALADRLIRLLRDSDLRRRMGEAGRRHVAERYTFGHFRERLSQLLMESVGCAS